MAKSATPFHVSDREKTLSARVIEIDTFNIRHVCQMCGEDATHAVIEEIATGERLKFVLCERDASSALRLLTDRAATDSASSNK